jgi:beta-lactamase superfamily II metal-dependent hydrolase
MKMNKFALIAVAVLLVLLLSGGCLLVVYEVNQKQQEKAAAEQAAEAEPKYDYETFANYTPVKDYASIPLLKVEGSKIGEAYQYGQGVYTMNISGTSLDDYKAYLTTLQDKGFKKHSDNGEEGMEGYVFTAAFQKDDLTVIVYHIVRNEATYITVGKKLALSDYMIYRPEAAQGFAADAKTKVHMLELNDNGNSFVIELKNGHFIVEDGGNESDAPYLLDYLESLTPGDEKPVIEAWFMSHAHGDHYSALKKIMNDPTMSSRIYVDGFYFVDPSLEIQQNVFVGESVGTAVWFVTNACNSFESSKGGRAKYYRMSLGQRYYFCDMSIDVTLTMDQFEEWYAVDFNDSSTWLMHNIEGQKFLHAGDAAETGCKVAMDMFDKEYFELDMFSVLHHGINVYNYFTDYCKIKTLLYTNSEVGSLYTATWAARKTENAHLQESVEESLAHGKGTVILTFPYKVGTSKKAAGFDWKYNSDGERDYKIWDVINGRRKESK